MKTFLDDVNEKINGVPIQRCYHCRKCTAGCPLAFVMEYNPNKVIKMIQMGMKQEVLGSSTIWLCASCETCITRCPNEVDIARMMDVLRETAINEGVAANEKNVLSFHKAFLGSIKSRGRINEPMLMVISFEKGRIFHTTLGHNGASMVDVGFQATLQRGTEWAATGAVTLPAPAADQMPADKVGTHEQPK